MEQETLSSDQIVVLEEEAGLRLDKLLSLRFPKYSRTYFQSLIEQENVWVNDSACKKREKLSCGDEVEIYFTLPPELSITAEDIPLEILYEDEHIIAIDKPPNFVVHPAPGHPNHTFVNALLFHCKNLETVGPDPLRPGIVHRLDKDTSGVLLAAKTSIAHKELVSLFTQRRVRKTYTAICIGNPKQTEIVAPIKRHPTKRQEMSICLEGGKPAITHLKVLETKGQFSLLELDLITGRTHQIRVHLKHIGHPILGDPLYGNPSYNKAWKVLRQMLHASSVQFTHPINKEPLLIQAPLPADMQMICQSLF